MYMRRFVLTFLILLLACGNLPVRGASPRFMNYTSADGLSSNTVLSMLQDLDGLHATGGVLMTCRSSVGNLIVCSKAAMHDPLELRTKGNAGIIDHTEPVSAQELVSEFSWNKVPLEDILVGPLFEVNEE